MILTAALIASLFAGALDVQPQAVVPQVSQVNDEKFNAAKAIFDKWRLDPVAFVREVLRAEPDEWQADALRAVRDNPRVAMSACKGPGKSCLLAWIIWWFLATHDDSNVVAMSITEDNLKDNLWKELAIWMSKSPILDAYFTFTAKRITSKINPNFWWCSARSFAKQADTTQQAGTLAGLHNKNVMVVCDEVGDYPDGVVVAAEGIFANKVNNHLILAGNPTRADGPLYRVTSTKDRKRWHIVYITGDPDDPKRSPRISLEWAKQMIDDWGRDNAWVMVNVLGLFPPSSADQLISANDVTIAMDRDADPVAFRADARIWGLDPARFGDDASALAKRQGLVAFQFKMWRGLDGPELAAQVHKLLLEAADDNKLPDALFVDVGGVGSSAYDQLKKLGWDGIMHAIEFAQTPNDERFLNKRAEIWWDMAQWLKKKPSCLPTDNDISGEMTAPKIDFKDSGKRSKFVLESKKSLRTRGVPSPNKADALALTFSESVAPKSIRDMMGDRRRKAKTQYNSLTYKKSA